MRRTSCRHHGSHWSPSPLPCRAEGRRRRAKGRGSGRGVRFLSSRVSVKVLPPMRAFLKRLAFGLCLELLAADAPAQAPRWNPVGLSGGGAMFTPAISPADPNLMMLNCDMSAAYISEDGGRNWRMVNQAQLHSDTACRPAFHPADPNLIYASS